MDSKYDGLCYVLSIRTKVCAFCIFSKILDHHLAPKLSSKQEIPKTFFGLSSILSHTRILAWGPHWVKEELVPARENVIRRSPKTTTRRRRRIAQQRASAKGECNGEANSTDGGEVYTATATVSTTSDCLVNQTRSSASLLAPCCSPQERRRRHRRRIRK